MKDERVKFAITVTDRIKDIYSKPFNGHPSREDEHKTKEAIMFLADQIDKLRIDLIRKR